MIALAGFAALSSCASLGIQKQVNVSPSLEVGAVAIYPFVFRWPEPAYRGFDLSMRIVGVAGERVGRQLLLFGPPEFKVYRSEDTNVWAASDLASLIPKYGLNPEQVLVLRPWAERRQAALASEVSDDAGRSKGSVSRGELAFIGHLEVLHPSSRTVIAELAATTQVDLFSRRLDDDDPTPELTKLMTDLTAEALKSIAAHIRPSVAPRFLPIRVALVAPELSSDRDAQDPLEREMVRLARVRFINPWLEDRDANRVSKSTQGLFVLSSSLQTVSAGDVIQRINGEAAFPQVLERCRFATSPVIVDLRRQDGEVSTVPLN